MRVTPLPDHSAGADQHARGRLLVIGSSRFVPGALRLTGEAALRAGCGRLRLATVEGAALPLGVLLPEAASLLVDWLFREAPANLPLWLDAAAIAASGSGRIAQRQGGLVFTPHQGEFARLMHEGPDRIAAAPARAALEAARA